MYWGNRAKTRDTFQGGWTKTGDKYVRNLDGTYTYAGRIDDMLRVSGLYVSPFEVEATLVQHPVVLEAAVIGVPDAQGLTTTKAFVVLKPGGGTTEAELKAFVKSRLAPYKGDQRTRGFDVTIIMVMKKVTLAEAKAGLSALLDRVESGETVAITRRHRVVAEVRPARPPQRSGRRPFGLCRGQFRVPHDFDAPLPEDILREFEGR